MTTKSWRPHNLRQVIRYHIAVGWSMRWFEFSLVSHPHGFYTVYVCIRIWFYKVKLMVNSLVVITIYRPKALYAAHKSDLIIVPGRINCLIIGNVAASRRATVTRNPSFFTASYPPKTHCSGTILPRLYFLPAKSDSSNSTILPGPPNIDNTIKQMPCNP